MSEQRPTIFLSRELPPARMETLRRVSRLEVNRHDWVLSREELLRGVADKDGLISLLTDAIGGEAGRV
jgi:hypothetical protein